MENMTSTGVSENITDPEVSSAKSFPFYAAQSGYDLPVYGLKNGQFYSIHIPAITCIVLSFVSAVAIIIASFRLQNIKTFFSWTKSERFVVYLALCDGLFNFAHSMDHTHIVLTRNHVYPKELCEFYGFMLAEFITAQNLMVNVVALNVFVLIYFTKDLNFGAYDWRLLLYTFGLPCVGGTMAAYFDMLGPNGTFCYFDGVKGEVANLFFTTVPLLTVLFMNIIVYGLTWKRIRSESKRLQHTLGQEAATIRASLQAAKTMSLFVTAFFAQWWAMALYGIWQMIAPVPQTLFQFVTTFSNIGGILNGIVYILIRRRRTKPKSKRAANVDKPFQNINSVSDKVENSSV
ncbi:uncharacterized protein LOC133183633 [Saccostrea echinata]|uniref:uncharacterized protein LOC133183633 n=1 Tax=Saccostrea echinata TaxID=191078 RepID=UPI002A7EDD4E|nr:uncharacterized protein LOC133183633 [Saccostrea echinata]